MTTAQPIARPEEVGLNPAALNRLSRVLEERVAAGHIPGAVALVARHGKVAYHESFGRLDPASGAPMTARNVRLRSNCPTPRFWAPPPSAASCANATCLPP